MPSTDSRWWSSQVKPTSPLPRCKAANTRLKATRSAAGSTSSSRSRIAVSNGARDTPYRFLRFDRMRSSLRTSRSKLNNDTYFSPNIASADIRQSERLNPRPATSLGILSKQPRTMRSNPGALSVLTSCTFLRK